MIKMNVQTPKLDNITVDPLTPSEKATMLKEAFGGISELNASNLALFLQQLSILTSNYLSEYEKNWSRFEKSFNLINTINNIPQDANLNSAYMRLRNQQGSELIAIDFIRTLEKGNYLLEYIRQLLTTQTIVTNFTVKSDSDIYYTDKSQVSYKLVLSTFGASGNNFVSLAYDVNIDATIKLLQSSIEAERNKVTGTDIYTRIMQVKEGYLADLRVKYPERAKSYIPRYDSTDAEIFDLLQQRLRNSDISSLTHALTVSTYRKMRKEMGGRGGYRTSSTQLGDVGLIQDKMVSQATNRVNFARQTLIYNRFKELDLILKTANRMEIKNAFLRMFTEKQSRVGDNISRAANKEAIKVIKQLFK